MKQILILFDAFDLAVGCARGVIMSNRSIPDAGRLGRWIRSWVQPDGGIHGFHNHSVWGGNPYRWADFTAGHSTWASPFIAGLAHALRRYPDARGAALLRTLVEFQTNSFQNNGNYRHIGFQVGELLQIGLIHNAITNVSLGQAVIDAGDVLGDKLCEQVRRAFDRNTAWHGRLGDRFCTNQEYARIWGKLLYHRAFDDERWVGEAISDIDALIERAHVRDLPGPGCVGTIRSPNDRDSVEPAEYYGLMIHPLLMAYELTTEGRYLDEALAMARHVARSCWVDDRGHARMHRLWVRLDGRWRRSSWPMLIAGIGDTLEGLRACLAVRHDAELAEAADRFDATLAVYQHPAGFFAAATGWQSEVDVAPASAWHAHDFRYLVRHAPIDGTFWESFWSDYDRMAVVLGDQCLWVEHGAHWAICDYYRQSAYNLRGRKDRVAFGRDMGWVGGSRALPDEYRFNPPTFLKLDEEISRYRDGDAPEDVMNLSTLKYVG